MSRHDPIKILKEAELDHLLDLPVADPFQRGGAGLLDGILCFLLSSGIDHAGNAVYTHLINLPSTLSFSEKIASSKAITFLVNSSGEIVRYGAIGLKLGFLIFAFGWLVNRFGGSPAKLLIGLRIVDDSSGKPLEINQAIFRQVTILIAFPGMFSAFLRKDKRSFHDLFTRTSVRKVHGVR